MPLSRAACMILIASFSSLTEPMCQPPRHSSETRSPVLPSGLVGRPLLPASSPPAAAARPSAAPAASDDWRNSRRLLLISDMAQSPLGALRATIQHFRRRRPLRPEDYFQA